MLRLAFVLALILVIPIADFWADSLALTVAGRVVWALSILLAFLVGAQAVYRHRKALDEVKNRAKTNARLPPAQRERVFRIKETAGRIWLSLGKEIKQQELSVLIEQLKSDSEGLLEFPFLVELSIIFTTHVYSEALWRLRGTNSPAEEEVLSQSHAQLYRLYRLLLKRANDILEQHPANAGAP
jgi:heme exporter protein D